MDHKHKYEAISHPNLSPEVSGLGLRAGEMRKCQKCEKVMPFVQTAGGWVPLFEERDADGRDILLA